MSVLYKILTREPTFLGKAIAATAIIPVTLSGLDDASKALINGAILLWVGWGERLLVTPEVKAKEREEAADATGHARAEAEVNALAVAAMPPPPLPTTTPLTAPPTPQPRIPYVPPAE